MKAEISDDTLLAGLSEKQQAQLEQYIEELLAANQRFNLTAIRDRSDAWERHIIECVRLLPLLNELLPLETSASDAPARKLLDVGSGGGLPGMVLAIVRPDLQVTLLEATEKKANFLRETAQKLGLKQLKVKNERAELAGAPGTALRESFDVVSARAVAALPTLLELAVPFVRVGGSLMAVKGERAAEEVESADNALSVLHCRVNKSTRQPSATVLFIEKLAKTPTRYPRRSGEPKKKPL